MGYRERAPELEWNYLKNAVKKQNKSKLKISDDGSYIINEKGKRIARNIIRDHRGYGGYNNNTPLLFWNGWAHHLDRVQDLCHKLIARKNQYFRDNLEPLMLKLLGNKKETSVWYERPGKDTLACYRLSKRDPDYSLMNRLAEDDPYRKQKHFISWSYDHIPSFASDLPEWQLPRSSDEGQKLNKMLDYHTDLGLRLTKANHCLHMCITMRLEEQAKKYGAGDLIRFKIGSVEYTFQRSDSYYSWTFLGRVSHEIDINSLTPKIHPNEMWQYELYRR